MVDLKNKVCVITGSGRGLGIAIAQTLGEAGADIVGCDIRQESLVQMETTLGESGIRVHTVKADVSDEKEAFNCVQEALVRFGRLDVLVNNAAVDITLPLDEMAVKDWDKILAVNLRGPFLLSKFAFSFMKERASGHIVNIVSTASKRAWANAIAYHASKWGLLGFSHALHVEGRKHNIKVTAVVSGGMKTPFLLDRFPDIDTSTLQDPLNVARTVKFILQQPDETVIPEVMVIPMKETSWP
ncbi:MAG: SDR family oxidoreductase [Candidatus Omnitrophota bacterium]